MSSNHSTIRENNTHLVLSEIIDNPEISRAELSKLTGLNKATISEIVRILIEDSYIIETGIGESSSAGGRKPVLLKINKHAGISISFDVRYDKISYMISYLNGDKVKSEEIKISIDKNNIVSIIEYLVNHHQKKLADTPFGLIGITISIHGTVSNNNINFTPYYNISEINLSRILGKQLGVPIYIENEANLAALAESNHNKVYNNLVSCSIHTGIGAGIIIDQNLYHGFNGKSGEIGHTTLYPNGIPCPCGNKGCFEQYCSEKSLLQEYRNQKDNPFLTLDDLVDNYQNEDSLTLELVGNFAKNLSIGLFNLIGTYSPEVIYINSEIVGRIPNIISIINQELSHTLHANFPILISPFGKEASLRGATIHNIQQFLEI